MQNYLIFHIQPTPEKLKDKRTSVFSHREQMRAKKEELQHVKVQPHFKQCLNKISALDNLCNAITNKTNKTPRWTSQQNHLNLETAVDDIKILGPVRFLLEGNIHEEKHMQLGKAEFNAQRGDNHGEILTKNVHTKKILGKLSKFDDNKVSKRSWSKMCELKYQLLLQDKLNDLVPIKFSFIPNSNFCCFVIKNEFTIEFKFETLTHVKWVSFIN